MIKRKRKGSGFTLTVTRISPSDRDENSFSSDRGDDGGGDKEDDRGHKESSGRDRKRRMKDKKRKKKKATTTKHGKTEKTATRPSLRGGEEECDSAKDSDDSLEKFIVSDEDYDQSAEEKQQEDAYGYYSEGSWADSESEEDVHENPKFDLQLNRQEYIADRSRRLRNRGQHVNLLDQGSMDPLDISMLEVEVSVSTRQAERRSRAARQGAETRARNEAERASRPPTVAASSSAEHSSVPEPWKSGDAPEEPEITEEEKKEGKKACSLCLTSTAKCVFVPCGHIIICVTCSQRYGDRLEGRDKCPACKQKWASIIKVYE
jgi:hypothetical protein